MRTFLSAIGVLFLVFLVAGIAQSCQPYQDVTFYPPNAQPVVYKHVRTFESEGGTITVYFEDYTSVKLVGNVVVTPAKP